MCTVDSILLTPRHSCSQRRQFNLYILHAIHKAYQHSLNVSFNRRIWNLPRNCHTGVVHSVGLISSIYNNIVFSRFCRLRSSALSHPSPLVRSIFAISSQTCNSNFIDYNCLYRSGSLSINHKLAHKHIIKWHLMICL